MKTKSGKRFDGIAPVVVTENGETYIELMKRNPKFNLRTRHREEPLVLVARITRKQATACGMLLIRHGK